MNATRISVVTNSLNQATFEGRELTSVINQKTDAVDYIVVDPGSTDGSPDLIERYSDLFELRNYASGICNIGQQATFIVRHRAFGFTVDTGLTLKARRLLSKLNMLRQLRYLMVR